MIEAAFGLVAALVVGWFALRIHKLESRVDELEGELHWYWQRERQLIDFIYRHRLTPPDPPERNSQ